MATDFGRDTTAGAIAREVYDLSTDALMAHSIRAVEEYLRRTYGFITAIILHRNNTVFSDTGRLSWCSVAENSGDPSFIFVQEDHPEWDHSRKRFCIAHELYHVIWAVGSATDGGAARSRAAESTCDIFANALCQQHDKFYEDQAKAANTALRFQGLPYRTV